GQLGDSTTNDRSSPVQIASVASFTDIAAGYYHCMALKDDGTLWAWGKNNDGQVGDGTKTDQTSPVQVSAFSNVLTFSGGYSHSLVVTGDGALWAWGLNSYGQMGDGSTTSSSNPIQITGLTHAVMVSAGNNHSLANRIDSTAWLWGSNSNGQLGDGTIMQKNAPIHISDLNLIHSVAAGKSHSLGLKLDGTILAWGKNANGQLGDTTDTDRLTPVLVLWPPDPSQISDQETAQDSAIGVNFTVSDEDAPCALTVNLSSSDQILLPDGNLSYTCNADVYTVTAMPAAGQSGIAVVSIMLSDSDGLTASTSFNLTVTNVNDAPVISSIADQTTNEDTAMNSVSFTVSDADNEPLTVVIQSGNTSLVALSADNITISNGSYGDTFTFTTVSGGELLTLSILPVTDMSGSVEITVTVSDTSLSSSTCFTLTVNPINDAPVITSISDQTTTEDTATNPILFTVADADSDILTVSVISGQTSLVAMNSDSLTISGFSGGTTYSYVTLSGGEPLTLTLLPLPNANGVLDITVTVSDGIVNVSESFTLTVMPVNDAPAISSISDRTTNE
ncbi:MAG: hypothetical protein OMM_12563, partial [Candidatus Magnetoglobus multicellularis str. Araruama]